MEKKSVETPEFNDSAWLRQHIFDILHFYAPRCLDPQYGGFYQGYRDDGSIYDHRTKHLVSSTRFVYVFSIGTLLKGPDWCRTYAELGLEYIQEKHFDRVNGGYYWILEGLEAKDTSKQAYGHAFVLLAASAALKAGISWAFPIIEEVFQQLEEHLWNCVNGLYADEASVDWKEIPVYRGQNANMHLCEALLSAYEATNDPKYLSRAHLLAKNVVITLATQSGGLIWEHYDKDWLIDWNYNKHDPKNLFRPYGFLPGHLVEWSKLLVILERYQSEAWMITAAESLFQSALKMAWDKKNGGICYAFDAAGNILDSDKYHWVISEAIAASYLLGARTGNQKYFEWYKQFFKYSWKHFIDHQYGAWYRILSKENVKYDNIKSPPSKTDYHPISACYETLRAMEHQTKGPPKLMEI
jgi:mannose/cellobiose epimerase-like protein (N-acyl-D-glucosamine 2-epimerase family)